jgi:enamine deaminase RidA (YjgF/YER057c/UK114 family)
MNIRTLIFASAVTLAGLVPAAQAQEINRIIANPNALFASVVAVPPGYTLYFVSGALPVPVTPAANGQPANWGDSTQQTQSVLNTLKASMAKAGLTFGDVVKATAFMGPDLDFQAMNKVWQTEFGTPAQPNKPARAAFHVHALAAPGAQLEIEFIAAKK